MRFFKALETSICGVPSPVDHMKGLHLISSHLLSWFSDLADVNMTPNTNYMLTPADSN